MNKMTKTALMAIVLYVSQSAMAQLGGQVFYHYGKSSLANARDGQVFTDTVGNTGRNDDKDGYNIGAGLDLPLMKGFGPGDLLGQVAVDYSSFSKKAVITATSALLGSPKTKEVNISSLNVIIAPKYRLAGFMDGKFVPWIIPAGLSFLVNSPPSDNTTYLDVGYHIGLGAEYKIMDALSAGLAYRNTFASKTNDVDSSYSSLDLYVGINF